MIAFTWILLMAAATRVELVDEVYQIPANEWRYIEVSLKQKPALVAATFRVQAGAQEVRLALMRREDLERLRNERPYGVLAATPAGPSGNFSTHVGEPGEYVVLVDNRAAVQPTTVHLRVWLDFAGTESPAATQLSPRRQLVVIVISLVVFMGIVTYSARRLWSLLRPAPWRRGPKP